MDQLEVVRGRMIDEADPVDHALQRKLRRNGDREVEPSSRRVDPGTDGAPGEPEVAGEAGIGEPDRRAAIRADPPDSRLVVGHVQVAGGVEDQVIPHREHPVAGEPRVIGDLGEDLRSTGPGGQWHPQDPAVHVRNVEGVARSGIAVDGDPPEAHRRVRHGRDARRVEERAPGVVGEHPLAVGVAMAAVRGIGEEVACARRDVHATVVDRDAERMARCRHAREDAHGTDARSLGGRRGRRGDARGEDGRDRAHHDKASQRPAAPRSGRRDASGEPVRRIPVHGLPSAWRVRDRSASTGTTSG